MAARIHPTAVVDPGAELADGVEVGPFAVVETGVTLAEGCRVDAHAHLRGPLVVGPGTTIGFSVSLGHDPQVRGKTGPFGATRIGARNVFREFAQVHRSMRPEGETVIGDDGYLMACSHVAHDCVLGDSVTVCNAVLLAGHVTVGDRAFLSGLVAIHQFARIGELAMVGGGAHISRDVAPFALVVGARPPVVKGINLVGLRRAGVPPDVRTALRGAYRVLFRSSLPPKERLASVEISCPEVERLVRFVQESRRGVHGIGGRTAGKYEEDADDAEGGEIERD